MRLSPQELEGLLRRLDGKGYRGYKRLAGLTVDHGVCLATLTRVQGDPYAPPSVVEARVPRSAHRLPARLLSRERRVPLTDFLARRLHGILKSMSRKCGTGNSCYLGVPKPGPWILQRSCVEVEGGDLVLRFYVGLPARGRRILGAKARDLLRAVPEVVERLVSVDVDSLEDHVSNYLDQEYLRSWLARSGYAAFVGDGSVLPRESSLSTRPMKGAVPFRSPSSLRVTVELPSGRRVSGMALPAGFTVITGGGYHGKTTLLEAIQEGVYNHVRGDGRELVVSRRRTVLVKAEDGRIVSHVDISSFVDGVPGGADTRDFSTMDASGSTSMAASISEALEAGAELLLIDEDTSATNLLYRDEGMEAIIREEPIRPLCLQVRDLVRRTGASVVAVASASSSLLGQADRVVLMENYVPRDVTAEARRLAGGRGRQLDYRPPRARLFHGIRGLRRVRAKGFKLVAEYDDGVKFELDLAGYPRLVEKAQVNAIACIVARLRRLERPVGVRELADRINDALSSRGFSAFADPVPPDLALVDGFDVVWVLNRMYNAVFSQR